jgi:single-strand DNA-binding protein
MNKVVIIGRLTGDPVTKQAGDATVVNITLAVDRIKRGEADFIPVVVWRKTAEIVAKYCNKGSQIAVCGRIQTRSYEKDGAKVYVTEVVADDVQLLGSPKTETEKKMESEGFDEIKEIQLPF